MQEKSPFTLLDYIRQRKRWIQGLLLVANSSEIPLRCTYHGNAQQKSFFQMLYSIFQITFFVCTLCVRFGIGAGDSCEHFSSTLFPSTDERGKQINFIYTWELDLFFFLCIADLDPERNFPGGRFLLHGHLWNRPLIHRLSSRDQKDDFLTHFVRASYSAKDCLRSHCHYLGGFHPEKYVCCCGQEPSGYAQISNNFSCLTCVLLFCNTEMWIDVDCTISVWN